MDGYGEGEVVIPGFRFYPTEEELITFYLKHKLQGTKRLLQDIDRIIPELHIYDFYPWDLPKYAGERCQRELEQWFFFIPRKEKEAKGGRASRLTTSGYWKATGSPNIIYSSSNRAIGIKRTMVFYNGRAPSGTKTKWKMNEYKAFHEEPSSNTSTRPELQANLSATRFAALQNVGYVSKPKSNKVLLMEEFNLCRVYVKSSTLRAFDRRPSRLR